MAYTLNQIFFFLYQNQNILFSNIGNQNIFLEKKHNPPFKLNGRSLARFRYIIRICIVIVSHRNSSFIGITCPLCPLQIPLIML